MIRSLPFFWCCVLCGCREEILNELHEADANRAYLALAQAGVDAEKVAQAGVWGISVPANEAIKALRLLDGQRVLTGGRQNGTKQKSSGLFQTKAERGQQLAQHMEDKLEQTLMRIPGVSEAHVHLNAGSYSILEFDAGRPNSCASVLLLKSAGSQISTDDVKELVGGAAAVAPGAVKVVVAEEEFKSSALEHPAAPRAETSAIPELPERRVLYLAAAAAAACVMFTLTLAARKQKLFLENLRSAGGA